MKRLNTVGAVPTAAAALLGTGALAMVGVLVPTIVSSDADTQVAFRQFQQRANVEQPRAQTFYASIVARPLFSDGRHEDPPAPPPKPAPPRDVQSYRLLGLVLSSDTHLALVERSSGGEQLRLHPGDHLDGWTVAAIDSTGVQLTAAGINATLAIPHYSTQPAEANIADAVGGPGKSVTGSKSSGRFLGLRIFQVPKVDGSGSTTAQKASGDN